MQETVIAEGLGCYGNLLRNLPKGVFRRGRTLYYRQTIPVDAQRLLGRCEIWRSLRTDSLAVALRRLPSVMAGIEHQIELARSKAGLSIDLTLIGPLSDDEVSSPAIFPMVGNLPTLSTISLLPSLTLEEAYRSYIDDPIRAWSGSTREAYETSRKLVRAIIGGELPLSSVSRAHCRDILDVLRFLPANASKLFPKLTPREAAQHAQECDGIKIISAANANTLMSNRSSFLNWAVNEEMLARNPARGLRLPDPVHKRDKRLPFTRIQLRAIFDAPLYRGCADGQRGYNRIGECRPRNARFWVPLIALFTGARLGEICQLDVTDIRIVGDINCFVVSLDSLVGSSDKFTRHLMKQGYAPIALPSVLQP